MRTTPDHFTLDSCVIDATLHFIGDTNERRRSIYFMKMKTLTWRKVGDCIECTSHKARHKGGYPVIRGSKRISRIILERRNGNRSTRLWALHTCDHPWCINPAHIVEGTHDENMRQMKERGRSRGAAGEKNSHAKLTAADILEILNSPRSPRQLAETYGIKARSIRAIRSRDRWKHVNL